VRELTSSQAFVALGRDALGSLRYGIRRRARRDPAAVAGEYDRGYWADVLARRSWERFRDLDEYVVGTEPGTRVAKVENRIVAIDQQEYYRYRRDMLRRVMTEWADEPEELVELGCGYGLNLFSLAGTERWRRLTGFEISSAALEAAKLIRAHFGLESRLDFAPLDLLDLRHPSFARLAGRTGFTYYCFEQLKHSTAAALNNIRVSGMRRVIHIEPTPELWGWWPPADAVSRLHSWSRDYQDNLLATLRGLEARGQVRILEVRRLFYAPAVRHDPTLICWEPAE
jgi:hypothetical protein